MIHTCTTEGLSDDRITTQHRAIGGGESSPSSGNTIAENNESLFPFAQATKLLIIATVQRFLAIESACGLNPAGFSSRTDHFVWPRKLMTKADEGTSFLL